MDRIKIILEKYKNQEIGYDQVIEQLNLPAFDDLGFAKVDHARSTRTGFSEVIFGLGKTASQICKIAESILQRSNKLLITRVNMDVFNQIKSIAQDAKFHEEASCISVNRDETVLLNGITVVSAGTSDLNVVKEIEVTSEIMGYQSRLVLDVGVAGIHRLLSHVGILNESKVIDETLIKYFDLSWKLQPNMTELSKETRKEAQKILPDYFIILAPNYSDIIIKKEKQFIQKGGKFIVLTKDIKVV